VRQGCRHSRLCGNRQTLMATTGATEVRARMSRRLISVRLAAAHSLVRVLSRWTKPSLVVLITAAGLCQLLTPEKASRRGAHWLSASATCAGPGPSSAAPVQVGGGGRAFAYKRGHVVHASLSDWLMIVAECTSQAAVVAKAVDRSAPTACSAIWLLCAAGVCVVRQPEETQEVALTCYQGKVSNRLLRAGRSVRAERVVQDPDAIRFSRSFHASVAVSDPTQCGADAVAAHSCSERGAGQSATPWQADVRVLTRVVADNNCRNLSRGRSVQIWAHTHPGRL